VTPAVPPPLGGDLFWRLVGHLAANHLSLDRVENLRTVLGLYNFRASVDRQAEQASRQLLQGIKGISVAPEVRVLRGVPARGVATRVDLEEDNFAGEGDMFLFSALLNEFFAQYVTLNSFSRVTVKGLKHGEVYEWPPRSGSRTIL
jgi:type VI secretion system protein ImpG